MGSKGRADAGLEGGERRRRVNVGLSAGESGAVGMVESRSLPPPLLFSPTLDPRPSTPEESQASGIPPGCKPFPIRYRGSAPRAATPGYLLPTLRAGLEGRRACGGAGISRCQPVFGSCCARGSAFAGLPPRQGSRLRRTPARQVGVASRRGGRAHSDGVVSLGRGRFSCCTGHIPFYILFQ